MPPLDAILNKNKTRWNIARKFLPYLARVLRRWKHKNPLRNRVTLSLILQNTMSSVLDRVHWSVKVSSVVIGLKVHMFTINWQTWQFLFPHGSLPKVWLRIESEALTKLFPLWNPTVGTLANTFGCSLSGVVILPKLF